MKGGRHPTGVVAQCHVCKSFLSTWLHLCCPSNANFTGIVLLPVLPLFIVSSLGRGDAQTLRFDCNAFPPRILPNSEHCRERMRWGKQHLWDWVYLQIATVPIFSRLEAIRTASFARTFGSSKSLQFLLGFILRIGYSSDSKQIHWQIGSRSCKWSYGRISPSPSILFLGGQMAT